MKGRVFLDTNILVYSVLRDDSYKHDKALHFLETLRGEVIFISTQVVNELYVSLLKYELSDEDIENIVGEIISLYNISMISVGIIKSAWNLRKRYKLSYRDSLIIASALESECELLYTENMQDGLIINGRLTIKNPFSLENL